MNELTNFCIQKNKNKKSENQPDYQVTLKEGETWITWGACWQKKNKNGETYLSCSKSKPLPPKEPVKQIDYPANDLGEVIF